MNQDNIVKLKSLKGFDLTDLLDAFGDDPQDLVDLLLGFKSRHEVYFSDIKSNLEKNDLVKAKELVHKLKGTAGNVGAVVLAQAATTLDAELRASNYKQETLVALEKAFISTFSELMKLA